MELSGFYKVTVKLEVETEDGKGNVKTKKMKEIYIVRDCGDPQDAVKRVEKEMEGSTSEWAIESVKEEKVDAII